MSGRGWLVASGLSVALAGSAVAYRALSSPAGVSARAEKSSSSAARAGEAPDNSQDIERLRAQLASVQGQLSTLRLQAAEQKASVSREDAPEPEPVEDTDPATLQAKREEDVKRWKDHMAEVAMAFEEETLDRAFAAPAQRAVEQAFQSIPVLQAVAGHIECRSRTCRVEVRDAKNPEVSKALPIFLQKVGGTLPNMQADHFEDESGRSTAVLYFTNEQTVAQAPPAK